MSYSKIKKPLKLAGILNKYINKKLKNVKNQENTAFKNAIIKKYKKRSKK